MSNYKNYLLRSMGVKEGQIKASDIDRDEYPGIDPDELEKGANDEKEEHHLPVNKAIKTAVQHLDVPNQHHYYTGVEKAKKQGMLKDIMSSPLLSPTAIATPVIGVAVRGSSTGGLPSGIDQTSGDISPSRLGGYEKVNIDPANSKLVNKTPQNTQINSTEPIATNPPASTDSVTHPFQVQKDAGEAPQSVTGASTDSDDTLTLKSAAPKGIDIDVAEEEEQPAYGPNTASNIKETKLDFSETFARHKELMKEKLNIKESTCKCGNPDCTCGCKADTTKECKSCGCGKPNTSHDMKENVGAEEPFETKWKMDKEKAGLVKISEAFDKLKVTADRPPTKEEPKKPQVVKKKYFDPKTKTTRDVDWIETPKEEVKEYSAPFERMRGLANLGERRVMANGLWEDTTITEGDDKWMQDVSKGAEEKGTKGALKKDLGVPEDGKIPTERLKSLKANLSKKSEKGTLNDKELKLFRRINAALNMRGEG